jgi:hypothetical protein
VAADKREVIGLYVLIQGAQHILKFLKGFPLGVIIGIQVKMAHIPPVVFPIGIIQFHVLPPALSRQWHRVYGILERLSIKRK